MGREQYYTGTHAFSPGRRMAARIWTPAIRRRPARRRDAGRLPAAGGDWRRVAGAPAARGGSPTDKAHERPISTCGNCLEFPKVESQREVNNEHALEP